MRRHGLAAETTPLADDKRGGQRGDSGADVDDRSAGEIDRGTMELLLAQPVPRWRLVMAHLGADIILIPILCLSLWAGLWTGAALVGEIRPDPEALADFPAAATETNAELLKIDVSAFGAPLANVAGLIFAVSGLTMWWSAAGRSRWRVIGGAAVFVLVQFIMNIVGQIWEQAAFLRPLSLFYYYQPQQIALRGGWSVPLAPMGIDMHMPMLLVLVAVGALGYALALRVLTRRDLPAPL